MIGVSSSGSSAGLGVELPRVARCSAPAKIMLFGEYAVLEGHPAVALCLDRRIACEVRRGPADGRLRLEADGVFDGLVDLPAGLLADESPPSSELALLWPVLRRHVPQAGGLSLRFVADFPPAWGLGSSSASTLAAVAALRDVCGGAAVAPIDLFDEVRAAQRSLQGHASGYDVAAQLLGGYVRFQSADPPQLERLELPGDDFDWVVAWSGRKAGTGAMIRDVRGRFPEGHVIYSEIGGVSDEGIAALVGGDARRLGRALDAGHALLERLGAVPDEAAAIVRALQADPDILGARLCGAGGGDCILVLSADRSHASACVRAHGLDVLDIGPEAQGLLREDPS